MNKYMKIAKENSKKWMDLEGGPFGAVIVNKEGEISDENPDYLDAQVLCRVTERATSGRVLVNYAQIADDSDENGNPIDDIDSTPDNFVNPDREFEDDEEVVAKPKINIVITTYYKGTALEESMKKLESYLDNADQNENDINYL